MLSTAHLPLSRSRAGWRSRGLPSIDAAATFLLTPLNLVLTAALRRAARAEPGAFARLGAYRDTVFVIAPSGAPVVFVLQPRGPEGQISVVPAAASPKGDARISGPLSLLLAVFDGSLDADSAFFQRDIRVEGDMEAMVALHNAMDAADLSLIDLTPAPAFAREPLGRVLTAGAGFTRRVLERARRA